MSRDLFAVIRPDGTATLTGIALVPRAPFTGPVIEKFLGQLQEQAAGGKLLVSFSGGKPPEEPWKIRLAAVAAMVEQVQLVDGAVQVVAKLLQTPMGKLVFQALCARWKADGSNGPSGFAFTVFAIGRTDADGNAVIEDAHAVSLHLVETALVEAAP